MARSLLTVYEDFQPQVEPKEEQGSNIIVIHLPGFAKEQINLTYVDSSRTIKVQGERPLEKNRRSRFNQAFPVPQNCIIEKIRGRFKNGILTITMPKKKITQAGPVKDANTTKETTPPKPISQQKSMMDLKETNPPKTASTSGVEKQRDEKIQHPHQTPKKVVTEPRGPMTTGPQTASPTAQTNGEKDVVKEKESGKTKDSTPSQTNIPKILEKGKKDDKAGGALKEKLKEVGSRFLEKAKEMKGMDSIMKTVIRLATDDYEDRQSLINIGVSLLVIVALWAYITYSYRSSGKAED
ncbi:hypothetical protein REPUB_Repub01dG0141900 [Reevesia pubescens]